MQILVTDGSARPDLLNHLMGVCKPPVTAIQIREKTMEGKELYELASQLVAFTAPLGIQIFINSRVDIALASHAAGVHLPENGISPSVVKKMASQLIVGCSVHSKESALQKQAEAADYIYFGPIFETPSKSGPPQGLDRLKEVSLLLSIPVIAIGGITVERAPQCIQMGAKGNASIKAYHLSHSQHESCAT